MAVYRTLLKQIWNMNKFINYHLYTVQAILGQYSVKVLKLVNMYTVQVLLRQSISFICW